MQIESEIIYYCAPVLIGIKPASMFSVKTINHPNLIHEIESVNEMLSKSGLKIRQVMRCKAYSLLFVYRPLALETVIFSDQVSAFLQSCGYVMDENLEKIVDTLFAKLTCEENFPHEVGVFLGYPLDDILGFVEHQGKNFKMFGYWKVYGDEKKAKTLFSEYDRCKAKLVTLYKQGMSFNQLCVAS